MFLMMEGRDQKLRIKFCDNQVELRCSEPMSREQNSKLTESRELNM